MAHGPHESLSVKQNQRFLNALFAASANFIYYKHVKNEVTRLVADHVTARESQTRFPGTVRLPG
jgi:hypothetical protein